MSIRMTQRTKPKLNLVHELPREDDYVNVIIHFDPGKYQPYVAATYWQPAEGDVFEDMRFISAEIDGDDSPLTAEEIQACETYFDSREGRERARFVALDDLDRGDD